jgi:hypothetical protein
MTETSALQAITKLFSQPVHHAAQEGYQEVCRLLLTEMKLPQKKDGRLDRTPLHCACSAGHLEIARMLLEEFKVQILQILP